MARVRSSVAGVVCPVAVLIMYTVLGEINSSAGVIHSVAGVVHPAGYLFSVRGLCESWPFPLVHA